MAILFSSQLVAADAGVEFETDRGFAERAIEKLVSRPSNDGLIQEALWGNVLNFLLKHGSENTASRSIYHMMSQLYEFETEAVEELVRIEFMKFIKKEIIHLHIIVPILTDSETSSQKNGEDKFSTEVSNKLQEELAKLISTNHHLADLAKVILIEFKKDFPNKLVEIPQPVDFIEKMSQGRNNLGDKLLFEESAENAKSDFNNLTRAFIGNLRVLPGAWHRIKVFIELYPFEEETARFVYKILKSPIKNIDPHTGVYIRRYLHESASENPNYTSMEYLYNNRSSMSSCQKLFY